MPDRPAARALFWIVVAFVAGIVLLVPSRPAGLNGSYDVAQFVAWMRSPIVGGDIDFTDDVHPAENALPHTITGRTHNAFPMGGPLLWVPFYAVAHGGTLAVRALHGSLAADGYSDLYQVLAHAGAFAIAIAGLLLAWFAARRVAPDGALPAVMLSWLGGFLIFYTHLDPFHAHSAAFATSAAFVLAWLWWRREGEAITGGVSDSTRALVMGLAGGLATLTRWQAAAMWLLVAADAWRPGKRRQAALAGGVAALVFIPQLVAWQILFGAWFRPPRGEFAGVFLKWTSPRMLPVLFSSWHGLLHWHPVLAVGLAGLIVLSIRKPSLGLPMLGAFALQLYLNAIVMDWWASGSFGHRRFDAALPLLVVGMAAVWPTRTTLRRWAVAVGAAFVAVNVGAVIAYARGSIPQATPASLPRIAGKSFRVFAHPTELFHHAASMSWWKAAWIVLAVLACVLARRAWQRGRRRVLRDRPVLVAAAGGVAVCVLVAGTLWAIRGRPPFEPHVFEARLLAPAPVLTPPGPRRMAPAASASMYVYVLPGFLPPATYRPEVSEPDVSVAIEGRVVPRGSAVKLRNGFYELRITNTAKVAVDVDVVALEPVSAQPAFAPEPLDIREHLR